MIARRRVQLPAGARFDDYTDYQVSYMNYRSGWLIPGTEVWIGDDLQVRINEVGCKGPELTPGVPVIGVFGDSTTFGMGPDSWPAHIHVPGYQPLNCAVEGHDLARLLERYTRLREQVDLAAVVIGGSWHNLVYNRHDAPFWTATLDAFGTDRPVAVCTLSTALVPECCERGLDAAIAAIYGDNNRFLPWGTWPTTPDKTRELYEGVMRYNDFVRAYCARKGRILIDLYKAYRPACYEQLGEQFTDPAHQRSSLYPTLGKAASATLAPFLRRGEDTVSARPGVDVPLRPPIEDDTLHRNIYPLW
jgi:hypothetical protein